MTVAELIAKLQQLPADKVIAIDDPDTNWHAPIVRIHEFERVVYICCPTYAEFDSNYDTGESIRIL